ncbi:MAG TPA: hypothetical protein VK018_13725 [Porticoccaceae bacterium]|jgi:hypothetical protein|nr:hypothetical protein [Porticoccaceae bacterium]
MNISSTFTALAMIAISLIFLATTTPIAQAEATRAQATGSTSPRAPVETAKRTSEPAQQVMRAEPAKPKPKVFAAPGSGPQEWKCTEYDSGATSCECKGMLDCKKLIDSGKCAGKSWWEAGDDPSVGGCDG